MTIGLSRTGLPCLLGALLVLSACASSSQLDTAIKENTQLRDKNTQLTQDNIQLQRQVAADQAHISRLQEAIKFTVNSDLLFPSGGWQLSAAGEAVIAK